MKNLLKADISKNLRADILRLQGYKSAENPALNIALGPINSAFPNGSFPIGAVHEFLSPRMEDSAATSGFIAALISSLMGNHGAAFWISASRTLFPPALKYFNISPEHVIFIDVQKESEILWVMEEALKCSALTAVVAEMREIDFTSSRRLQLAVEKSNVTGFILRNNFKSLQTTACVSRWKITSLPSTAVRDLPGIGYPKWRIELLRMRNGKTGVWEM